jgi:ABC-type polysaccharide/polyol phosphate transport system ATPase subunit
MSNIAIKAVNISKKFEVRTERLPNERHSLFDRMMAKLNPTTQKEFWALKDVSFEINEGESVGIIGMNGAGKTTLLKILSDIILPTSGKVSIHGRLAAILEIGVGFHQELSGRENISLYGKMLGFTNARISSRFDEIVEFSELKEFIDAPIKHYSSGMIMRLGFSLIAMLETDIILLDEMLSVGDLHFRSKCLNKIVELKNNQRTVVIVGHDIQQITNYCDRIMLLDHGQLVDFGPSMIVIEKYNRILMNYDRRYQNSTWNKYRNDNKQAYDENLKKLKTCVDFEETGILARSSSFRLISAEIASSGATDAALQEFDINNEILVSIKAEYFSGKSDFVFVIADMMNNRLFGDYVFNNKDVFPSASGIYLFKWTIPAGVLNQGVFKLGIVLFDEKYNPVYSMMEILSFAMTDKEKSMGDFGLYVPVKPKINFSFSSVD